MRKIIYIPIFLLLLSACREDPVIWTKGSTELVISEYVAETEGFSEFASILEQTNLSSLLSVRGPFTLFLPSDSVMNLYYDDLGRSGLADFTLEEMETLALNHMVPIAVESGDVGLGSLREFNGIGDYLVTEFQGSDIIVNKQSIVIDRDIIAANGVVHLVDRVIEPVERSIYQVLEEHPGYSIFAEGLERTGLKDTLNMISFPYGDSEARTRFTVIAIADTTFQRFGINNVDELIAQYTDAPDSITYIDNPFYRYMEYHCLGETYYLNLLEDGTALYPILSYDNNMTITVTDDYKFNWDRATDSFTGIYEELCNFPAKNGTFHTVDDLLPVFQPEPTTLVWETTDHFDMKQGDYFGQYYARWFDGKNTFEDVKWEGDYLLYYFKDHDTGKLMNHDCLSMSGWWWCEVRTPKIMKGKYTVYSNLWGGQISYAVYIDGVQTALIGSEEPAESTSWGVFDWTETERHTIRVVAKTPGLLFWDTMIFEPAD